MRVEEGAFSTIVCGMIPMFRREARGQRRGVIRRNGSLSPRIPRPSPGLYAISRQTVTHNTGWRLILLTRWG